MRCLIVGLVILSVVIGAFVWVWQAYGFWGAAGLFVMLYAALWVLSKVLPVASQGFFKGMFDELAGPMKAARVEVLRVEPADETERLREELKNFDEWLNEELEDGGADLTLDAHEAFFHDTEGKLLCESYIIELSISPPEPGTSWSPYGLGFRPVEEPFAWGGEIVDIQITEDLRGDFHPFEPTEAFEELTGARRLRLIVRLPTEFREYRISYLHGDHWDTIVTLPPPPEEPYVRRLTDAVVDRLSHVSTLVNVSFWGMPLTDADVAKLTALGNLKRLDLSSTSITDAAVPHLQTMTQLTDLSVSGTKLSAEGVATLKKSLPNTNVRSEVVNPFG